MTLRKLCVVEFKVTQCERLTQIVILSSVPLRSSSDSSPRMQNSSADNKGKKKKSEWEVRVSNNSLAAKTKGPSCDRQREMTWKTAVPGRERANNLTNRKPRSRKGLMSQPCSTHHPRRWKSTASPLLSFALTGPSAQATSNWRQLKSTAEEASEPPGWQVWFNRFWGERLILV